ncbi:hypothetical protein O9993_13970 [Vibrio lentus]|nr:hypothetical protein [Vibrio lentus]
MTLKVVVRDSRWRPEGSAKQSASEAPVESTTAMLRKTQLLLLLLALKRRKAQAEAQVTQTENEAPVGKLWRY